MPTTPMQPEPIALATLESVTGGSRNSSVDLVNQLSAIADSVTCLSQKTGGFSSSQFLLFAVLAMANQRNNNVVYVGGPRWWW